MDTPQDILARSIFAAALPASDGNRSSLPRRLRSALGVLEKLIQRAENFQAEAPGMLARLCPAMLDSTPPNKLPTGLTAAPVGSGNTSASQPEAGGGGSRLGSPQPGSKRRPTHPVSRIEQRPAKRARVSLGQTRGRALLRAGLESESPALALQPSQVQQFVCQAMAKVVPPGAWGGGKCRSLLLHRVADLVKLNHHDAVPMDALLQGIPTDGMEWLEGGRSARGQGPAGAQLHQSLARCWMSWLLRGLAIPLIRSHFYATEGDGQRGRLLFYRKCDWARVQSEGIESTVRKLQLRRLGASSSASAPAGPLRRSSTAPAAGTRQQSGPDLFALPAPPLGLAVMRLVPKQRGWRPVANLANKKAIPQAALTRDAAAAARRLGAGHALDRSTGQRSGAARRPR